VLATSEGKIYRGRLTSERRWARSSAEEHYLDMVGVTGSIPVAPTIFAPTVRRGPASGKRAFPSFKPTRPQPDTAGGAEMLFSRFRPDGLNFRGASDIGTWGDSKERPMRVGTILLATAVIAGGAFSASAQTASPPSEVSPATHCKDATSGQVRLKSAMSGAPSSAGTAGTGQTTGTSTTGTGATGSPSSGSSSLPSGSASSPPASSAAAANLPNC
jgi:hypothetical protein